MRPPLTVAFIVALAGCAASATGAISARDVPVPPDPDCVAEQYAYFGESSIAALGVTRPSGRPPPDPSRVGTIWITADRRVNAGEPVGMAEGRMLCIEYPNAGAGETSLMTNFPVVDSWQPPGLAQRIEQVAGVPWPVLPVAVGVSLLIAASFIAFRGRR
jgi:hypothetical protein